MIPTDATARAEIARIDAIGPDAVTQLLATIRAAELTSPIVAKSKPIRTLVTTQDHRTSSYLRRLMLDRIEADTMNQATNTNDFFPPCPTVDTNPRNLPHARDLDRRPRLDSPNTRPLAPVADDSGRDGVAENRRSG